MASPENPLRKAVTRFFGLVLRTYFRNVEVVGDVPDEQVRGRLFGANHVNALVDPILVVTSAKPPISPVAKHALWQIPFLRPLLDLADAVPVVRRRDDPTKAQGDNDAVFERVGAHLATGGNILIFPEGTSHNEPALVPLRSGAGRMLARARSIDPAARLTVQPVGLTFDEREIFRSRALVVYGNVVSIDDLAADSPDDGALANRITEVLRQGLADLVVEGRTWEDRVLIGQVAELLAHEGESDAESLHTSSTIGKEVQGAHRLLGDAHPAVQDVRVKVSAYYRKLAEARVSDATVRRPDAIVAERSPVALAAFLAVLPVALFGAALYFVPYQVPRLVARATKEEASDMTSTTKLGVGLLVFPLWALGAAISAFVAARSLGVGAAAASVALVLASPFAAIVWVDHLPRLADTFGLVLGRGRGRLEALRAARAEARAAIEAAREKLTEARA
ncbi:MAG: 1-acyl-sn-glycerol-3-phosphate acyltransferase [Myxococcales bacterium]|nr:1-acyl-sn-glycerol-3-phosphate acyltransferase [Myxococcales bacterium]